MTTVSCIIMGGLGNQLFQIFTTFAYSLKYNKKIILPYSLNNCNRRNTYWDTILSSFKKYTTNNPNCHFTDNQLFKFEQYKEKEHHYIKIPEFVNNNILFYGYFQSPKYFEEQIDKIFDLLNLEEKKEEIRKEFPNYHTENSTFISMHFRLGDYKFLQNIHPIISYEYYYNSLSYILCFIDIKKKYTILYFCEEEDNHIINPIINKLSYTFPIFTFIKVDDNIKDWQQLLIMSNCQYNIIANSTFSWWGAYFNNNNDKIVCYPSIWFGPSLNDKKITDMFPIDWVEISNV